MILRSIQVENWRCFMEPVKVGPFSDTINVVHAPNGTGKSTLVEALSRGLFDWHGVSGRDVEAMRPWGRDLSPKVVLEFSQGGEEYRLTKGFLGNADSLLERQESGAFKRLSEGDAADERVREMLAGVKPGRGAAVSKHWGLAQVLWAPQGKLELAELTDDLVGAIRGSLGAQVVDVRGSATEARIREVYHEIYTPKGKFKRGKDAPELVALEEEVAEAQQARRQADDRLRQYEEAVRRAEDLGAEHEQAGRNVKQLEKDAAELKERADAFRNLKTELERRSQAEESATARHSELKQRVDEIARTRRELGERQKEAATLEEDLVAKGKALAHAEKEAAAAVAVAEDARSRRGEVDEARELAGAAARFVNADASAADLEARLAAAADLTQRIETMTEKRAKVLAPDKKAMGKLKKLVKRRDDARVRLESAMLSMEIVPERDGEVRLVEGEEPGVRSLQAETPLRVRGEAQLVVDLPGVARIRVEGPAGSVEELRGDLQGLEQQLAEACAPFGTTDLEELEQRLDVAGGLDTDLRSLQADLDGVLDGHEREDLQAEATRQQAIGTELLKDHPEWKKDPPDVADLDEESGRKEKAQQKAEDEANAGVRRAEDGLRVAGEEAAAHEAEMRSVRRRVAELEKELQVRTDDGLSDKDRSKQLKNILLEWDAARAGTEEVEKQLAGYPDDPAADLETLRKQLDAAQETLTSTLGQVKEQEGRLAELASKAPYAALARAEEQLATLEERLSAEELRANAIRLLHDTVSQCRQEVIAAVAAPVEEAATRTLQRIAGPRLGRLRVGEDFVPAQIVPNAEADSVPISETSGGEQEQLHLAVRLALADLLAKDERQLLVLDDVLTYTDTPRFARILRILEEAAQNLQLLILTCHPERYRGLEEAAFVDLGQTFLPRV